MTKRKLATSIASEFRKRVDAETRTLAMEFANGMGKSQAPVLGHPTTRNMGESDEHFRERIKAQMGASLGLSVGSHTKANEGSVTLRDEIIVDHKALAEAEAKEATFRHDMRHYSPDEPNYVTWSAIQGRHAPLDLRPGLDKTQRISSKGQVRGKSLRKQLRETVDHIGDLEDLNDAVRERYDYALQKFAQLEEAAKDHPKLVEDFQKRIDELERELQDDDAQFLRRVKLKTKVAKGEL